MSIKHLFLGVVLVVLGAVAGISLYSNSQVGAGKLVKQVEVPTEVFNRDMSLQVYCPGLKVISGSSLVYEDGSVELQPAGEITTNCVQTFIGEF